MSGEEGSGQTTQDPAAQKKPEAGKREHCQSPFFHTVPDIILF